MTIVHLHVCALHVCMLHFSDMNWQLISVNPERIAALDSHSFTHPEALAGHGCVASHVCGPKGGGGGTGGSSQLCRQAKLNVMSSLPRGWGLGIARAVTIECTLMGNINITEATIFVAMAMEVEHLRPSTRWMCRVVLSACN